jgi:hypothetical protein
VGYQVNFYLIGEDNALLQRLIESAGPVAFVKDRQATPDLIPVEDLRIASDLMGKVVLRVYAVQPAALSRLPLRWIPEQNHHIVDVASPAIEVDRCFFDGQIIRTGRIYAYSAPWHPQDAAVWADFKTWSSRVMRRVVEGLNREGYRFGDRPFISYFGPEAAAWMERVGASFSLSGQDLTAP